MLLLQKWEEENIQTKLLSCTRKKPIIMARNEHISKGSGLRGQG